MSARINTILILGATRGIGEAMARRFHSMGKKVIATGRGQEQEKLHQLAHDLPGLEVRIWDLTDLTILPSQVASILTSFPRLDTVFINAAVQNHYLLFQEPPCMLGVVAEVTTNLTAPILLAHAFAPHLLALARAGVRTTLFLTSSSLAYFPVPFYPTYCATKAGVAAFAKILRMQLQEEGCTDMRVVEVVPPYVDTALNAEHRERTDALQGGTEKAVMPMPLGEYIEGFFEGLDEVQNSMKGDGGIKNEIGVGFGEIGVQAWYEGNLKLLHASGMAG